MAQDRSEDMATQVEALRKEIAELREDIRELAGVIEDEYELSDEAVAALKEARNTPIKEYAELK